MTTKYVFELVDSDGKKITMTLSKNLVSPDDWSAANPGSNCLVVSNGFVDSSKTDRLICHTGPDNNAPVMTFVGANWASKVHDTGDANCDLCESGCSTSWNWELKQKT